MRDLGDRFDVDHLECWIGWSLQKEGLGVGAHSFAPLLEIGAVDQGRIDAVAGEVLFDNI
jgi:hypothetical protein